MPQENGTARPLWFLFTPSYWGIRIRRLEQAVDAQAPLLSDGASPEVAIEAERMLRNGDDPHVPVRLVNLTQVCVAPVCVCVCVCVSPCCGVFMYACRFRKWGLCSSSEDVTAVNRLTFSIAEGQVFCLLGHNGAGKVTHPLTHYKSTVPPAAIPSLSCGL